MWFFGRRDQWASFFLNEAGAAVSVNGLRYQTMINDLHGQNWKIWMWTMCENVMENLMKRAWFCKRSRGGDMNDNVFHY